MIVLYPLEFGIKIDAVKMLNEKGEEEPQIDFNEFYETVLPLLVERIPSFRNAHVINAWYSYEDVNTFDGVPVLGEHFHHTNFYQV
jgi:glycine/D-amino acid oxidase-like deaminating enzyme